VPRTRQIQFVDELGSCLLFFRVVLPWSGCLEHDKDEGSSGRISPVALEVGENRDMRKSFLFVLILAMGSHAAVLAQSKGDGQKEESRVWTTTFDGYAGTVELVAPMNGALELLVATHLRSWVSCNADGYILTVGGYIYERLGGATTAEDMRSGLEVRYPGNPIVHLKVTSIRMVTSESAEVDYLTRHQDGLELVRTLMLQVGPKGWTVNRVRRQRYASIFPREALLLHSGA